MDEKSILHIVWLIYRDVSRLYDIVLQIGETESTKAAVYYKKHSLHELGCKCEERSSLGV